MLHEVVCFQMLEFETLHVKSQYQFKYFTEKLLLSQKLTSEGAVSLNVLYYQQLSTTPYQVSFYANNYFE